MSSYRTSRKEQQEHVDRWIESGLSKAAYCRKVSLSYHLLVYWSRRHAPSQREVSSRSHEESGFVEVTAASLGRSGAGGFLPAVVIRLPGGVELACGSLPDALWVRRLAQESQSC